MVIKKFIKEIISKRKAIYLLIGVIIILGYLNYSTITKSLLPQADFPYVSIYTEMIGASPKTIEKDLTNKLEEELNDLGDLIEINSSSSYGSSLVILKFDEEVSIEDKIRTIQTKIDNINYLLPEKSKKSIVEEYDINNFPIIMIELENNLPYKEQMKVYKTIERNINSISGVSKVEANGLITNKIQITPNINNLNKFGISESEIIAVIKANNERLPIGSAEISGNSYNFQVSGTIEGIEDIENIIVRFYDDKPLYIRDLCEVKLVRSKRVESFKVDKRDSIPTVLISVFKKRNADTVTINTKVHEFIDNYNSSNDYGIKLDTSLDLAKYISKSISDVITNALGGLLSVIVVLFFFIGMREALIASTVIPITLISTFLLFDTFDITLNIFSIMGLIIALGMLVDNAIVVIEMIDEKKKENRDMSIHAIVVDSTSRVAPAILASTITTVLALLPLVLMKGDIGSLIREIPLAAIIAMSISFITSITITPILASQLIKHENKSRYKKLTLISITLLSMYAMSDHYQWTSLSYIVGLVVFVLGYIKIFNKQSIDFIKGFEDFITPVMHSKIKRIMVLIITMTLFMASLGLLFSDAIKKEAMPESDDINFLGTVELPNGSVMKDSRQVSNTINNGLIESGYVNKINYYYLNSKINYIIELVNKKERRRHSKEIIKDFNQLISEIPDVNGRFSSDGEGSSGSPIRLRLLGDSQDDLIKYGNTIVDTLKTIEGAVNPRIDFKLSRPTFDISIDNNKCGIFKVNPVEVMLKLQYLTTGVEIMRIEKENTTIKTVLKYEIPYQDKNSLKHIMVTNNEGNSVPLIELVDIKESRFNSELKHYNGKKTIEILSDKTSQGNTNIIMNTLIETIDENDILPGTIDYQLSGESKEMDETFTDLFEKMLIAGILVYIVLVLQFNSYMQPFAIILSIPYAIIGVVLGFVAFDLTFSTLSFLGIVALVGIAVNDAIVLIDYINMLRDQNQINPIDSIIEGVKSRFVPIIATSLTTIAGVLPLAFYNEDYSSMAYAIVFGLIFSTVLTLIVVPVTLITIETVIERIRKTNYKEVGEDA